MGVQPVRRAVGGVLVAAAAVVALSLPSISNTSSANPSAQAHVPSWEASAPVQVVTPELSVTASQAGAAIGSSEPSVAPAPVVVPLALPQYLAVFRPDGSRLLKTRQQIGKVHVGQTNGHWNPIDPPVWDQAVYWESSALAGTDSTGTTWVYGHACKHHTCPFTSIGLMSRRQLRQLLGGKIVVWTSHGRLTYTIDTVGGLSKTGKRTLSTTDTSKPGNRFRIVLCEYDGLESLSNYYVEGLLTSAESA